MMIATQIIKPCKAVDGISVIYLVRRKAQTIAMITPVTIAINGMYSYPYPIAKANISHESAHVGPTILNCDPPNKAAKIAAKIAVIIPCNGVAHEATAKEIDKGTEITLTANQDL